MRGHHLYRKSFLQGTLWWEDNLYTEKNLSSRDTVIRGHPLYSKTCLQGTLWWEDTLYTEKPFLKEHCDKRTPSIQKKPFLKEHCDERTSSIQKNLSSRDTVMRRHPVIRGKILITLSYVSMLKNLWWRDTCHVGTLLSWDIEVSPEDRFHCRCMVRLIMFMNEPFHQVYPLKYIAAIN